MLERNQELNTILMDFGRNKMKNGFVVIISVLLVLGSLISCEAANIGFIAPRSVFEGWELPLEFPDDKEYVIGTMEIEEPGLKWLVEHLDNDLGHTTNLYNSGEDDPADVVANNDLVLISEAISSSQVGADYASSSIPVLSFEVYILDDMSITTDTTGFTGRAHGTEIHITNTAHPITKGLPETFTVSVTDDTTGKPAMLVFGSWDTSIRGGEILAELPTTEVGTDDGLESRTNAPILAVLKRDLL
jgi:hypothetical protein